MVFLENGKTYDTMKDECIIECRKINASTQIYKTKQNEYYYITSYSSNFPSFGLLTKEEVKEIRKSKEFDLKKLRARK